MKKTVLVLSALVLTGLSGCVVIPNQPQASVAYSADDQGAQVDVVAEADVTPIVVDQYYFVGGRYYYWHPGEGRYVVLRGRPPEGHRIVRRDHLDRRDRAGHVVRETGRENTKRDPVKPPVRQTHITQPRINNPKPPQHQPQPQKKQPEKKE